jgi:hypothetical protein
MALGVLVMVAALGHTPAVQPALAPAPAAPPAVSANRKPLPHEGCSLAIASWSRTT